MRYGFIINFINGAQQRKLTCYLFFQRKFGQARASAQSFEGPRCSRFLHNIGLFLWCPEGHLGKKKKKKKKKNNGKLDFDSIVSGDE